MTYRTSFQCPDTGSAVVCNYAFGKLTCTGETFDELTRLFDDAGFSDRPSEGELRETERITNAWCERVNGHYSSVDSANQALLDEGVDGFELLERW